MIHGYFDTQVGWPAPRVRVFLLLPGITTEWKPVEFLLDTGATLTVVQPLDTVFGLEVALDRFLDPRQWPTSVQTHGVGGVAQNYQCQAQYAFEDDGGGYRVLNGSVLLAQFTVGFQSLPSLLGRDVLNHFEYTINHATQTVTLNPLTR